MHLNKADYDRLYSYQFEEIKAREKEKINFTSQQAQTQIHSSHSPPQDALFRTSSTHILLFSFNILVEFSVRCMFSASHPLKIIIDLGAVRKI